MQAASRETVLLCLPRRTRERERLCACFRMLPPTYLSGLKSETVDGKKVENRKRMRKGTQIFGHWDSGCCVCWFCHRHLLPVPELMCKKHKSFVGERNEMHLIRCTNLGVIEGCYSLIGKLISFMSSNLGKKGALT